MSARCEPAPALRASLRAATQIDHDALDRALGRLDLAERRDYARFLSVQLRARAGVEEWLMRNAPGEWMPPSTASLLRRDLDWLGEPGDEETAPAFDPEAETQDAWLGAAWVIAGSSLGNRMMERDLAERVPGHWPMAFLRDGAMPAYFKALRPKLENSATNQAAERAAKAVFAHFLSQTHDCVELIAA